MSKSLLNPGQVLFALYINELLDNLSSKGLIFANYTNLDHQIRSQDNEIELQADIIGLNHGTYTSNTILLTLDDFKIIQHAHRFVVNGNENDYASDKNDLDITIDSKLKFEEHISRNVKVANATVR